jgi:hypothetical protein
MLVSKGRYGSLLFGTLFVAMTFISGCVNHLEKGWEHFGKGQYQEARGEWEQHEKPKLPELMAKADAAFTMAALNESIATANAAKDYPTVIRDAQELVSLDKWETKDWLKKSPVLQAYLDDAHISVEEGYYNLFNNFETDKDWEAIKTGYPDYQQYVATYNKETSARITAQYDAALLELKKIADEKERKARERARRARLQADVHEQIVLGKQLFLDEEYKNTMVSVNKAYAIIKKNPGIKFETGDLEYLKLSALQSIKILKAIEEERQRMAAKERKRIEAANRKAAKAARKIELETQRVKAIKIKMAAAAEKVRLKKEEKKRRVEAERKRKIEERNRRWRAFLKKGAPLKPLVTTVYKPSVGIGKLKVKKSQKWQGGSQLPKPKDKSIAAEDVYALEVEIPKTHKLTYLRNYSAKKAKSLLSPARTQGGKRSYYTENFKGGRYYLEVKNERAKKKIDYETKARIYKIPVTN